MNPSYTDGFNEEKLKECLLANFYDGDSWEDADALLLTKHGALDVAQYFTQFGFNAGLDAVVAGMPEIRGRLGTEFWEDAFLAKIEELRIASKTE